MKRIGLYLGVSPSSGGMFQYAQSILDALISCRDLVEPVAAYADTSWEPILAPLGCHGVRLGGSRFGPNMADLALFAGLPAGWARRAGRALNPMVGQLEAQHCDLWIFPAQEALAYQLRCPTMVTVHDLMHRYESRFPEVSSKGRARVRDLRFANMVDGARAVLVDSDIGRQQVVESYGANPHKIWALPYVPPRYVTDLAEPEDFDRRYRLPGKFIFYPAQFWSHKNHLALLEAVALGRKRGLDIELVCTGAPKYIFAEIEARAAGLGLADSVHFPGYVPDDYMAGFYRRARALVMPTHFGPTNIPPLEAFACECPVAVSNIYAMPEQVGDAAILFDQTSVPSIADAIGRLWVDDALCDALRARGRVRSDAWRQQHFNERFRFILQEALSPASSAAKPQP